MYSFSTAKFYQILIGIVAVPLLLSLFISTPDRLNSKEAHIMVELKNLKQSSTDNNNNNNILGSDVDFEDLATNLQHNQEES